MTTAVITIVHGRHDHLDRQTDALQQALGVDLRVVVAMDDPVAIARVERPGLATLTAEITTTPLGLPLATARNVGAQHALAAGADLLVFLDVDCLPVPGLAPAYSAAAGAAETGGLLLCGPVAYLPADIDPDLPVGRLGELVLPHRARPAPAVGDVVAGVDHSLFWSLSFALDAATWRRIGGFCEDYVGYGGEDTDFSATARALGIELAFVGGARAFHQFHPTAHPPVQHLADIVRNANLYHRRWGTFPMRGWLERFATEGLVELAPTGDRYRILGAGPAPRSAW